MALPRDFAQLTRFAQPEDSKWDDVFITWAKVRRPPSLCTRARDYVCRRIFCVKLPRQDFSIDDNAVTISFPPGCVAPANAAGLAKALSSKRRPHVTTVDLQVLCVCDRLCAPLFVMQSQSNPLGDAGCRRILAVMPAVFPMLQVC